MFQPYLRPRKFWDGCHPKIVACLDRNHVQIMGVLCTHLSHVLCRWGAEALLFFTHVVSHGLKVVSESLNCVSVLVGF